MGIHYEGVEGFITARIGLIQKHPNIKLNPKNLKPPSKEILDSNVPLNPADP